MGRWVGSVSPQDGVWCRSHRSFYLGHSHVMAGGLRLALVGAAWGLRCACEAGFGRRNLRAWNRGPTGNCRRCHPMRCRGSGVGVGGASPLKRWPMFASRSGVAVAGGWGGGSPPKRWPMFAGRGGVAVAGGSGGGSPPKRWPMFAIWRAYNVPNRHACRKPTCQTLFQQPNKNQCKKFTFQSFFGSTTQACV